MALAAKPADRNNRSALPPAWAPILLNQHSVSNEDAVFSESSWSQNTTHSARSTTATSFDIQGSCSDAEAQAPGSQSGGDIELSSISGHGYPNGNPPQPILEDSTQSHGLSVIATEEQNESRNTFESCNRQWSFAIFFQDSLRSAYQYIPKYEITSNTMALMALILTAFFGYETYKLAQESNRLAKIATGAQLRQTCNDEKEKGAFSEVCKQILSSSIESPYVPETSNFMRRVLGFLQHHGNATVATVAIYPRLYEISTPRWSFVFYGSLINLVLLITACTISGLNGGGFQSIRRLRRTHGSQPSDFDPVDFSLAHSQPDENASSFASGLQANQPRARRRVPYTHTNKTMKSTVALEASNLN
ncbi:hypothetical protein GJ744_007317 [Endocarpon pusillum]|uniref:Uncharacterized protein n=1 Tax=Endocarpon pusillum TaxID=364733 RepID=A0A8H7AJ22_9EURO|nr:hypothetical protein GJ744_007317 [Endocarpon pusillum]